MPAFIALAASRTSGTNRMPSRKSMPTIFMPATSASSRTLVGAEAAAEQDVRPLDDLVLHAVVEVVVHLLDELVVGQGVEVDVLGVVGHVVLPVPVTHAAGSAAAGGVPHRGTVPYDGTARTANLADEGVRCPASSPSERAFAVLGSPRRRSDRA